MRSRWAILPPITIGVVLVWRAMAAEPAPPMVSAEERRVPVSYITTTPSEFRPSVEGYGTVFPARVWTAVAEVSGQIVYRNPAFVRGGFVAEGEVLVKIATDEHELALDRAAADLAGAEARLKEMQLSERTTSALLAIERESLALAEADLARATQLREKGTVAPAAMDERRRNTLAQQSKVQTHMNALELLPSQIAAAEHAVYAAEAAHDAAVIDVVRTVVRAPFDARVARIDIEIGQFVGAGTTMGVLDGAATAEIDVQVPQNELATLFDLAARAPIKVGDPHRLAARVHLNTADNETRWDATVARLSDAVSEETRSVGVIVSVDAPYAAMEGRRRTLLVKGMFVRVELSAPPVTGVMLLPREAIQNGHVIVAGANDRLVYAEVAPVFVTGAIAVLAPGALPAGTRIVTSRPTPAIEGLLLDPRPDRVAAARLASAAYGHEL